MIQEQRSGTRWTSGWALERWQRDKVSKFLHLKQPRDFIRPMMNAPWITHCHQRANAWLKVVDIIGNLFCLFFCLRLSVAVRVSVYLTVSVYQSRFHGEKGARFQSSSRKCGRNEVAVYGTKDNFNGFRLFLVSPVFQMWVFLTSVTFVHLSMSDRPVLSRAGVAERQASSASAAATVTYGNVLGKGNSATLFISVMPVGNKCLHTWVSSNGQFADGAGAEAARGREGSLGGASVGPRQRSFLYRRLI